MTTPMPTVERARDESVDTQGMNYLVSVPRRIVTVWLPLTVFLATGFVGCGAVALHLAEGHSTFLPAFYMPLQLFWLCRAVNARRLHHALLAGATFALAMSSRSTLPELFSQTWSASLSVAASRT